MFYALMVIALLAADQISKLWAAQSLSAPIDVIPGFLAFTYAENRGAAFGIMPDMQPVFIIMSIVFAIIVSIYLTKRQHSLPVLAQLGGWLAVTGALGNMIDRALRAYVIDFIYAYGINFPVFNLFFVSRRPARSPLVPYPPLFRSEAHDRAEE